MGIQPVALPTVMLSTHTGGFGAPARPGRRRLGGAVIPHHGVYHLVGRGPEVEGLLSQRGLRLAPEVMRPLCRRADLILPNATEAGLLLEKPLPDPLDEAGAQALADELAAALAPNVVVTGLQLDKYIACAGAGRERFVVKKLHIARNFPGTGDLYGVVLIGSLIQGNALSAAADNAAEFVALAIQKTPYDQDTRFGVWFEPLLPRLCPLREE